MADFKFGSDDIADLKFGNSAVQAVYAGNTLVWQPSSGTDDWDTYDDGIFHGVYSATSGNTLTEMTAVSSGSTPTSTNYYSSPTRVRLSGYPNATARPAVAIWIPAQTTAASTNASGVWQYYTKATDQTAAGSARTDYEFVKNNSGGTSVLPTNRDYISYLVLLTATSNVEDWTDYDGPIRWDTVAPILYKVYGSAASGTSATVSYEDGDLLTDNINNGTPVPTTISRINTAQRSGITLTGGSFSANGLAADAPYSGTWVNGSGWFVGSPIAYGTFKSIIYSQYGSNLPSNFSPGAAVVFYSSDPGNPLGWTDYDGPVANWDTYANGVYGVDELKTSARDLKAIPGYTATTYTDTMTSMWLTSVTGGYVPTSGQYIQNYDGDEAPYIAVYINEYADDDENIAGSSAQGWYVFKNDTPSSGTYSRTNWETPVAWPSDVSSSRVSTQNESGYLGSNCGVKPGFIVVLLDEYNDPEGSGGTDHWTKPPVVWYGDVSAISGTSYPGDNISVDQGAYLWSGSYRYEQVYNGFDVGPYGYTDFTPTSTGGMMRYGSINNVGDLDVEVYLNGTKTHTAVASTSTTGTKSTSLVNVAYSDYATFCSNVSIGDEIIVVLHYGN